MMRSNEEKRHSDEMEVRSNWRRWVLRKLETVASAGGWVVE